MASRSLDDLHPAMKTKATLFIDKCRDRGVEVLIYCTYRSGKEQDELYKIGRTVKGEGATILKPMGHIVTNARSGQSAHNYLLNGKPAAKAWDCCPTISGKAIWDQKHPHWKVMGEIGEDLGLNWYGKPGAKFKEYPHFEMQ